MTGRALGWAAALVLLISIVRAGAQAQAPGPGRRGRELIDDALTAQGGASRLRALHSLALEVIGHGFALEQSERPEGPWLTTYTQQSETRDFDRRQLRSKTERRNWSFPIWSPPFVTVAGEEASARLVGTRWLPTPAINFESAIALDPERLLLTAEAASDLRALPDEVEQRIRQHVVGFTFHGSHLRLSLNPWTHLPTMLEQVSNTLFGGSIWGDITLRRWYSFWTLEKGGLMYPRQTTTEWNGFPYADQTIQGLAVDEPIDEGAFALPDDVRAASKALPATAPPQPAPTIDESKVIALSDTVIEIPGNFNVSVVHQPDGLVVIEGTTSPAYSAAIWAYMAQRFPGVPLKALITTSDAWPHIGGVREYIAKGIPIYALDLNVSILTRLANAPHTIAPDTLARAPRQPLFRPVSAKTALGSGATEIDLIPLPGEIGERMMIASLPAQHLVYSSDSIQRLGGSATTFFMPEMLQEVALALDREHITGVDRVFGMHLQPTSWHDVTAAIEAAKGSGGPAPITRQ
jgi:hypothetical protein